MKPHTVPTLPIPDHVEEEHAYRADYGVSDVALLQKRAVAWSQQHDLKPVGGDRRRVHLLVIDDQRI